MYACICACIHVCIDVIVIYWQYDDSERSVDGINEGLGTP